jgi:G:T-mismatch repair DNA endonuclease (very short patch repair protein)
MSMLGKHQSLAAREKVRAFQTGRIRSSETRARMSAAQLGKHPSPETLSKMSTANLGKHLSDETRAKISAANANRIVSIETRYKISASKTGHAVSLEARAKMRAARLGKHLSEETRARISTATKGRLGKPHTAETCAKMREARIGKPIPWLYGISSMRGKHHTPEARARISTSNKGKHCNPATPETRAKISASHRTPDALARIRAQRARQVFPFRDTKPEIAVQTLLQDCGIEFATHRHISGLLHQWDIVIESKKTLIEVDGCYWHGCTVCKLEKARSKPSDTAQTIYAQEHGWTVIRIRECEIKKDDFRRLKMLLIEGEHA